MSPHAVRLRHFPIPCLQVEAYPFRMDVAGTLITIGLILMALELFVPGGILAVFGLLCLMGAVIGIWMDHGATAGLLAFLGSIIVSVALVFIELSVLKRSPIAHRFFLTSRVRNQGRTPRPQEAELVGRTGETVTTLAPSGIVLIDGRRYEAASQDGLLERGTPIQVVGRDAFRIVVRRLPQG